MKTMLKAKSVGSVFLAVWVMLVVAACSSDNRKEEMMKDEGMMKKEEMMKDDGMMKKEDTMMKEEGSGMK